ncbi:MAG TPA: chemotaxis protein CheA [Chitinispirillaceae bacterium]|nr:chemotaxis protein CheA [Chitinispirillaceae bacterium]
MSENSCQSASEYLEELSAAFVLTDPTDLQALADLHTRFENISGFNVDKKIRDTGTQGAALLEKIILNEIPDLSVAMKTLSDMISEMRQLILTDPGKDSIADTSGFQEGPEEAVAEDTTSEIEKTAKPEEVKAIESASPLDVDLSTIDGSLLGDFISESEEHLHNADNYLLQLESTADIENINALFRVFHTIKGIAGFLSLYSIQKLAHSTENLLDKVRKNECPVSGRLVDLVFSAADALKQEIGSLRLALSSGSRYVVNSEVEHLINELDTFAEKSGARKIGEILIDEGKTTHSELEKALSIQHEHPEAKIGEILVQQGSVRPRDVNEALAVQQGKHKTVFVKESIKVDTEKLDKLVNTIGELVITEAMVTGNEALRRNASTEVLRNMRLLDKITRQLQEIGLSMRMISLKSTFQKMARLSRDLAKKAGKEINFITAGEDTELDKIVVEKIGDPLVHMVRNAADHGLEPPQERLAAGKPAAGTISLRAYQKGGSICIELEDDGRGLDRNAIINKALKQGIIKEGENISEQEIYHLVFRPGFSTARTVTDISGRGVGMDVVKKSVEALRGHIEIKTEQGKGTLFTIHLPLTMAIMDGMVVRVHNERYIVPTLSVIESFRPRKEDVSCIVNKGEVVNTHGELIPLIHLSTIFNVNGAIENPENGIVIVLEDMGKRMGLLVDSILGQQQTVIKKVGDGIGKIKGVSGAAIMPDGRISLILDVSGIIRMSMETEKSHI